MRAPTFILLCLAVAACSEETRSTPGPADLGAPDARQPSYATADPGRGGQLYKTAFGTPGGKMHGGKTAGFTMNDLLDVGAYCQTLP